MGLRHAVITSVTRDDLPDGGASVFADVTHQVRDLQPGCTVEVLIPDFRGEIEPLRTVLQANPDVLNHNLETVRRLFKTVQPRNRYEWSLEVLEAAAEIAPQTLAKSGLMVGLGETTDEVLEAMQDLHRVGVSILTIGQYLQPSRRHLPIARYYSPDEFEMFRDRGLEMGFRWVESAPLVRSSFHAGQQIQELFGKDQLPRSDSATASAGK
jgi:lipoic acid synthetase